MIKKILLATLMVGSFSGSFAQVPAYLDGQVQRNDGEKRWFGYGDFGYDYQNNDNSAHMQKVITKNFSINPGIGYRLNEHVSVGLQGTFSYEKTTTSYYQPLTFSPSSTSLDVWTFGAFVRCSHGGHNGKPFYFYHQLNLGYMGIDNYNNASSYSPEKVINGFGYSAFLFPAIGIHLHHSYSLTLNLGGIGYNTISQDGGNGTNSEFVFNFGQQIKIGVSKDFNFRRSEMEVKTNAEPMSEIHSRLLDNMTEDEDAPKKGQRTRDMDED